MVKVKKRNGKLEEFRKSKVIRGCKKAGANSKQAMKVARDVSKKIAKLSVVPASRLSNMIVKSLKRVNKKAASAFVSYRNKKLKRR